MSDASVRNPFDTVSRMLVSSIENRERLAEDLKEKLPSLVDALVECALGVWKQQDVTNKKGEHVGVKVYQVAPDARAINALMRLANYEPEEVSAVLLSMSRVRSMEAELEAGVPQRKAENLRSQTYLNEKNADAFAASFVVEEDVQGAALSVFSSVMGYIQSIPVEVMRQNCKDQDAYQSWQMQVAKIAEEAYETFVDPEKPLLGLGDDDEAEENEDE